MIIYLLLAAAYVMRWLLLGKMGRPGWEGLIPFYSSYAMFEILYGEGMRFLMLYIPFYGLYIVLKLYIDLARRFGKSTAFGFGLCFLNPIFLGILVFGPAVMDDGAVEITDELTLKVLASHTEKQTQG